MSEGPDGRPAFGVKGAEIVLALFFLALGAIVIYDSVRLGIGWRSRCAGDACRRDDGAR